MHQGYVIHDKILKNLDDRWTRYCFKLIDKWKVGANYYYIIETVQEGKCTFLLLKIEE